MESLGRNVGGTARDVVAGVSLATGLVRQSPDEWTWDLPETWLQGRGVWGGLILAGAVRAAELVVSNYNPDVPVPSVRSVSGAMAAPLLAGRARLVTRVIRRGSAVTTIGVDLINSPTNEIAATTNVVIAGPRVTALDVGGPAWEIAPPDDVAAALLRGVPDVPDADTAGLAPEFFQHLAVRPIQGYPGQQDPTATTLGWLRLIDENHTADAAWLAAMTDAWWTMSQVGTDGRRPVATVSFHTDLIADPTALDPSDYLLHVGRTYGARAGYVSESRELWTRQGTIAARMSQVVAVIR